MNRVVEYKIVSNQDVAVEMPAGMPFYDFVQEEGDGVYVPPGCSETS